MKIPSIAAAMPMLLVCAIAITVSAQQAPPPVGGPPPEAYSACDGKSKGDACRLSMGQREITGTCEAPPPNAQDTRLACRPTDMPAPHGQD